MPSLLPHAFVSTSAPRAFGGLALILAAQAWAFCPPNCPPVPGLPQATSTLTVNIAGSGRGRVVSVTPFQNFIDCGSGGSDCSETFTPAATLPFLLRAQPNAGSRFLGWSGGGCGGPVDCPVSVVHDMTVTASFGPAQQTLPGTPVLSVTKSGSGRGTVSSLPPFDQFINCGNDCSETVQLLLPPVVLVANASPGSHFIGWTAGPGSCVGRNVPCPVLVTASTTVTARFDSGPAIGPDLVVQQIRWDSPARITFVVKNIGNRPSGPAKARASMRQDNVIPIINQFPRTVPLGTVQLDDVDIPRLLPGTWRTLSIIYSGDVPPNALVGVGTANVIVTADADNAVGEQSETNNSGFLLGHLKPNREYGLP